VVSWKLTGAAAGRSGLTSETSPSVGERKWMGYSNKSFMIGMINHFD
jgi:hypothetical protein